MYLNREMYTYQDMENVGKMAQPMIQKVTDWLLLKVAITESYKNLEEAKEHIRKWKKKLS